MKNFIAFFLFLNLSACVSVEEPVNEHYLPPTGETQGSRIDNRELMQQKPSSEPEEEDASAPAPTAGGVP